MQVRKAERCRTRFFFAIQNVFVRGQSMAQLQSTLTAYEQSGIKLSRLATFLGNHDNPRFWSMNTALDALKSAAVFVFFAPGVPIWYYGDEALFTGQRDPFWVTQFDGQNIALSDWLPVVLAARKAAQVWTQPFDVLHVDQNSFIFQRGAAALVALTNQQWMARLKRTVQTQLAAGTVLCNVFWPSTDCITIGHNGLVSLYLDNGEAKIYTL